MKSSRHDNWGSAKGPITNLSPQARITCGACVLAACLAAPADTPAGVGAVAAAVLTWLAAVRPPLRVASSAALFGLVVFSPYFLLTPLIRADSASGDWLHALTVPWTVFFRGMTATQVCVATATSLTAGELRQGLARLPIPHVVSAILIQIVHQTAALIHETRRMAAAIAVRGGTKGYRTALRVLGSLPRVWLPRVVDRAERVACAMELRGYCRRDIKAMGSVPAELKDVAAVGLAFFALMGTVALRFWSDS